MRHEIYLKIAALAVAMSCCAVNAGAGTFCGNARLDPGENCDDGNREIGDGCSAACQVEPGFRCSAPYQPLANNVVADGGFELGAPSNIWNEQSNQNPTVLCSNANCPGEGFSRNGAWWARLGSLQQFGESFILQRPIIPPSHRYLEFDLAHAACGGSVDLFEVRIDEIVVFQSSGADPRCASPNNYEHRLLDLQTAPFGPYNDGQRHDIMFRAETFFEFNTPSLFLVDNVRIGEPVGTPTPSRCEFEQNTVTYEDFDPGVAGDLGALGLTTIELLDPVPWGTTDDGFCGSGDIPPGNFTGGAGEAACLDANASGNSEIFSFFCTDALDLSDAVLTELSFLLNVQFGTGSPNDFFTVLVGTQPPDPATIGNYQSVFTTFESQGVFAEPSGVPVTLSLDILDGQSEAYVCFGFASTSAYYAQVDNTEVSFIGCTNDDDSDKLQSCFDNCVGIPNTDQRDTDGDGYGNACDGDINRSLVQGRVPSGNGNDCIVNVLDLALLRAAFFSTPESANWNPDADFNGDTVVNVEDLGLMKFFFFQAPGPSGVTSACQGGS